MTEQLEWNTVVDEFENLVKYASGVTYRNRTEIDRAIGPDDLYQFGMLTLYKCWEKYRDRDLGEFKALFSKALFRGMRREANKTVFIALNEELAGEESYEDRFVDNLIVEEGVAHLKEMLSPLARAILLEIIEPSPATLWAVWADGARKRHLKETQSKRVRVPRDKEVRLKHIREALQLTQKQFDTGVREIRDKAPEALGDAI